MQRLEVVERGAAPKSSLSMMATDRPRSAASHAGATPVEAGADDHVEAVSARRRRSRCIEALIVRYETIVIDAIQRYWNERIHDLEMTDAAGRLARVLRRPRRVPLRQAALPAAARRLQRLPRPAAARSRLRHRHRSGALRARRRARHRRRSGETAIDLARKNFALHGLQRASFASPTARRCRLPTRRSTSSTATA